MPFPPKTAEEQNQLFTELNQIMGMIGRGNVDLTKAEAGFILDGTIPQATVADSLITVHHFRYLGEKIRDWDDPNALDEKDARLVGMYDQWFGSNAAQSGSRDHVFELRIEHNLDNLTLVRAELYGLSRASEKTNPPFPGHPQVYEFMGYVRGTDHAFPAAFGQQFQVYEDPNHVIRAFPGHFLGQTNPDIYYWMDPPPALNSAFGSAEPAPGAAPGPYLSLDNQFTYVPPLAIWEGSPYYNAPRAPLVNEYRASWGTIPTGQTDYYLACDTLARDTIPRENNGIPRGSKLVTTRDIQDEHDWVVLVLQLKQGDSEDITPVSIWAPAVDVLFETWSP